LTRGKCNCDGSAAVPETGIHVQRVALLLAGGDGTRLQELTQQVAGFPIPKQYCRLLHGRSLLENAISRACLLTPLQHVHVVVNQNHLRLATDQLRALPERNIFVQPSNRDTGPGMLFAMLRLARIYPDAIVAAFPTDHYVDNDRVLAAHIARTENLIAQVPDKVALLGIPPEQPDTGYGYILPADPFGTSETSSWACSVEAFREKPDLASTFDLISRGALWNTLVMVFKLKRMLELLQELAPVESLRILESGENAGKMAEVYAALNPWNLSNRVLARITQHLIVIKAAGVRWSDLGTRESVERTFRNLGLVPSWGPPKSTSDQHRVQPVDHRPLVKAG
jgi:mannose-1-phosphate guanylyltransferase